MKKKEKPNNVKIAEAILEQYKPTTVGEMQNALKDIFGPMFEAMLQGELTAHLGYDSNSRVQKDSLNRRNGYNDKILHTSTGDVEIQVPRDHDRLTILKALILGCKFFMKLNLVELKTSCPSAWTEFLDLKKVLNPSFQM